MSTMYSRSAAMLEQSKNALKMVQRVHNIYKSLNETFLETQERNNQKE